jgi:hypothetical protein
LTVIKCQDFSVTGKGNNAAWKKAMWHPLLKLDTAGPAYATEFKILYSLRGIYVLLEGKDYRISTQFDQDFQHLFDGDVFEVFFQPDTSQPLYLEYEVNALDKELVLMVSRANGKYATLSSYRYADLEKVKKVVHVSGGRAEMMGSIRSWTAELFFPYAVFTPLQHVPPSSGSVWHANFYRIDYDSGSQVKWAWSPVESSFHEFHQFGSLVFE